MQGLHCGLHCVLQRGGTLCDRVSEFECRELDFSVMTGNARVQCVCERREVEVVW